MRLKEESGSYKAESLKKKEFKQLPDELIPVKKIASKKNTNRWCKGVVGKEHNWVLIINYPKNESNFSFQWRRMLICTNCKKQDHNSTEYKCRDCGEYYKGWKHDCKVNFSTTNNEN